MGTHIFFTDVDGTLLRGNMPIAGSVKAAARRFVAAGGRITLATGRSHLSTGRIVREMGIALPCILYSGAMLYDFGLRRAVSGTPLPVAIMDRLAEVGERYPALSVQAYGANRIYLLRDNDLLRLKGVREEREDALSSIAAIDEPLFKIVMACPDAALLRDCGETVFSGEEFHFAFASRHFAEVVAAGACKGSAVRVLSERLGVPLSRTFAAGDAMTDYPMLKSCGHAFAMAGSPGELVDISDDTVPSCEEGGLAKAFDIAASIVMRERRTGGD